MHLRICTTQGKSKTYRYVQLVQSIRRNGVTTQKIIANLGDLPDQTVDNLKLALGASREGKPLIVAQESPGLTDGSKVQANLRYLDLAVMLQMWRNWRLDDLVAELLPETESAAPSADVVAALTLQRSISPGSKLYAQRWLPTTALPELPELAPERFNNTRIHRVLDDLFAATPALQKRLPLLYDEHGFASSAFFIDVTDTYFEGRGCEMAERNRTKAGHRNKWAIGIVLLVNDRGFPLRWQVIASKTKDHLAMGDMVDGLAGLDWLSGTPFVCDRAMGKASSLRKLYASGLHFLTAAPVDTIESYTTALPYQSFSALELAGTDDTYEQDVALVTQTARELELEEVDDKLFVLDLGVVKLVREAQEEGNKERAKRKKGPLDIASRLRLARQFQGRLESGEHESQASLARELGLSRARVTQILNVLRLAPDIQECLLACSQEVHVSEHRLRRVIKEEDPGRQREMLGDVLDGLLEAPRQEEDDRSEEPLEELRLAAYFNPKMFVDQRRRTQEHLDELKRFVEELNRELSCACQHRKEAPTRRKLMQRIERHNYTDVFEVTLEPITVTTKRGGQVGSFRCELRLKPEVWRRRRRYDGFVLLLGHPKLSSSGKELALLYRGKDVVEKDFQTIKSVIKLRPIFSHTDPKVQAHVTICMLALLLNRTLEERLKQSDMGLTAPACLEVLATCHLNRMKGRPAGRGVYSVTEATKAQRELLRALDLGHLVDDRALAVALSG
jgi:transcriptional regulator with XRE-family HTH domain